jgi:SAM-dependent methyltransferase
MTPVEQGKIILFHRQCIARHAQDSTLALGWKNQHSQDTRFAILASLGDVQNSTVLDVGCGHGDLKAWLDRHSSDFSYVGIDLMPEFIAVAQQRFAAAANTVFYQVDFSQMPLPQLDYVFASGALSYRNKQADFARDMIKKLHDAARCGLGFNMLDKAHFQGHPLLTAYDRDEIVAYCRSLPGETEVISGYQEDDFTVLIRK